MTLAHNFVARHNLFLSCSVSLYTESSPPTTCLAHPLAENTRDLAKKNVKISEKPNAVVVSLTLTGELVITSSTATVL